MTPDGNDGTQQTIDQQHSSDGEENELQHSKSYEQDLLKMLNLGKEGLRQSTQGYQLLGLARVKSNPAFSQKAIMQSNRCSLEANPLQQEVEEAEAYHRGASEVARGATRSYSDDAPTKVNLNDM